MRQISFFDSQSQVARLQPGLDRAMASVLAHGRFILGPEVGELEAALAARAEARHCVTCANGTEAITLYLMARGVGPGQVVFTPAFTFIAAAEAIANAGATPYFVDVVEDTYNMDPACLEAGIADAKARGLDARGIIAVDLFGQPADYRQIEPIARDHGLWLLSDAAQSFGAVLDGRPVGSMGDATTISFFPVKPLGCFGDGGAVFLDDADLADAIRSLRAHGGGRDKYNNVRIGLNSRLDTLQAAILLQKLTVFDEEIAVRRAVAAKYGAALRGIVGTPRAIEGAGPVWAAYTVRVDDRDSFRDALSRSGVPSMVYYSVALPDQPAYWSCPVNPSGAPVSRALAKRVLSIPLHPYLEASQQSAVIDAVSVTRAALAVERQ